MNVVFRTAFIVKSCHEAKAQPSSRTRREFGSVCRSIGVYDKCQRLCLTAEVVANEIKILVRRAKVV